MTEAFLALGANLGDRAQQLRQSLVALAERGVRIAAVSRFHSTAPVGGPCQPDYLNAVARVETSQAPLSLLATCMQIERQLGRERSVRNGPRTCDLDLLWYGGRSVREPQLTVPHPRFRERRFVLAPWAELVPRLRVDGQSVSEHLAALD